MLNKLNSIKEQIIEHYTKGLSTRQIAPLVGLSYSYIHKLLRSWGLYRSKSEAALLRQLPSSIHWRSSRAAARKVWARAFGPIPKGFHIHHKDGDYTNNNLENLECIDASTHAYIHHPINPIPRHLRPERKEYMRAYLKKYTRKVKSAS